MDEHQLLALKPELDCFLDRFAPFFGADGNQAHARRFVQGLLRGGDRRNAENIAEAMVGGPVRTLQAFIATGVWPDREILREMRCCVLEVLGDEDAVWNSDETGFPKKGSKSVGVKRQYSGTLGRTDNCQVAVFTNYCSTKGHTFMDRRLFLPQEWASDRERRQEAGVPEGLIFRTKPELALEMVADAVTEGIPVRWVGGDSIYGNSPTFAQGVRQLGKWYVLDVSSEAHVWTKQPQVIPPEQRPKQGRGRSHTLPLVVSESEQVDQVVAALPASAWASHHRSGRESGAANLRVRGGMGLVQRGGAPWSSRTIAGATLTGAGTRVEVSSRECTAGSAANQSGAGTRHEMDDRGGHSVGQGGVRSG